MDVLQALVLDGLRSHFPKLHETIRLNISRGRVDLCNVDLSESLPFTLLSLPFHLTHGMIGNLSLHIPWTSLGTSQISVNVQDVTLSLSEIPYPSLQSAVFDALNRNSQQTKLRLLAEEERRQSPLSRILQKVAPLALERLKVVIENVKLFFSFSDGHIATVTINNITVSPDATANDCQILELSISGLCICMRHQPSNKIPFELAVSLFTVLVERSFDVLQIAFSISEEIEVRADASINVFMEENRLRASNWIDAHISKRPSTSVMEDPQPWFQYMYHRFSAQIDVRSPYISVNKARAVCRHFTEYKSLHVLRLSHRRELSPAQSARLREIESLLTTEAILHLRARARKDVLSEEVSSFATREWLRWALFNNQMSHEREKLANDVRISLQAVEGEEGVGLHQLSLSKAETENPSSLSGMPPTNSWAVTKVSMHLKLLNFHMSADSYGISVCIEGVVCSGHLNGVSGHYSTTLALNNIRFMVGGEVRGQKGSFLFPGCPDVVQNSPERGPLMEVSCSGSVKQVQSLDITFRAWHVEWRTSAVSNVVHIINSWTRSSPIVHATTTVLPFATKKTSPRDSKSSPTVLIRIQGPIIAIVCSDEDDAQQMKLPALALCISNTSIERSKADHMMSISTEASLSAFIARDIRNLGEGLSSSSDGSLTLSTKLKASFDSSLVLHANEVKGSVDTTVISHVLHLVSDVAQVVTSNSHVQNGSAERARSIKQQQPAPSPALDAHVDSACISLRTDPNEDESTLTLSLNTICLGVSPFGRISFTVGMVRLSEVVHGDYLEILASSPTQSALSVYSGGPTPPTECNRVETKLGNVAIRISAPTVSQLGRVVSSFQQLRSPEHIQERAKLEEPQKPHNLSISIQRIICLGQRSGVTLELRCSLCLLTLFESTMTGSVQDIGLSETVSTSPMVKSIIQTGGAMHSVYDHTALSFTSSEDISHFTIDSAGVLIDGQVFQNISNFIMGIVSAWTQGYGINGRIRDVDVVPPKNGSKFFVKCSNIAMFASSLLNVAVFEASLVSLSVEPGLLLVSLRKFSISMMQADSIHGIRNLAGFEDASTILENADWDLTHRVKHNSSDRGSSCTASHWVLRILSNVTVYADPHDLSSFAGIIKHLLHGVTNKPDTEKEAVVVVAKRAMDLHSKSSFQCSARAISAELIRHSTARKTIGLFGIYGLLLKVKSEVKRESLVTMVTTIGASCTSLAIFECYPGRNTVSRVRVGAPKRAELEEVYPADESSSQGLQLGTFSRIDGNTEVFSLDATLTNLYILYRPSFLHDLLRFANDLRDVIAENVESRTSETTKSTPQSCYGKQDIATQHDKPGPSTVHSTPATRITVRIIEPWVVILCDERFPETVAFDLKVDDIEFSVVLASEGGLHHHSHVKFHKAALSLVVVGIDTTRNRYSSWRKHEAYYEHILQNKTGSFDGRDSPDIVSKADIVMISAAALRGDQNAVGRCSLSVDQVRVESSLHYITLLLKATLSTCMILPAAGSQIFVPFLTISVHGVSVILTLNEKPSMSNVIPEDIIAALDAVVDCTFDPEKMSFHGKLMASAYICESKNGIHDEVLQSTTFVLSIVPGRPVTINVECIRLLHISVSPASICYLNALSTAIALAIPAILEILPSEEKNNENQTPLLLQVDFPGVALKFLSDCPRTQLFRLSLREFAICITFSNGWATATLSIDDILMEDTISWRMNPIRDPEQQSRWSRLLATFRQESRGRPNSASGLNSPAPLVVPKSTRGSSISLRGNRDISCQISLTSTPWVRIDATWGLSSGTSLQLQMTGVELNFDISMYSTYKAWFDQIIGAMATSTRQLDSQPDRRTRELESRTRSSDTLAQRQASVKVDMNEIPVVLSLRAAHGNVSAPLLQKISQLFASTSVTDLTFTIPPFQWNRIPRFQTFIIRAVSLYGARISFQLLQLGIFQTKLLLQLVGVVGSSLLHYGAFSPRSAEFLSRSRNTAFHQRSPGLLLALANNSGEEDLPGLVQASRITRTGKSARQCFPRAMENDADGAEAPLLLVETIDLTSNVTSSHKLSVKAEGVNLFRILRQRDTRLPRNERFEKYFPFSFDKCLVVTSHYLIFTSRASTDVPSPVIDRSGVLQYRRRGLKIIIEYKSSSSTLDILAMARTGCMNIEVFAAGLRGANITEVHSYEFQCLSVAYAIRVQYHLSNFLS